MINNKITPEQISIPLISNLEIENGNLKMIDSKGNSTQIEIQTKNKNITINQLDVVAPKEINLSIKPENYCNSYIQILKLEPGESHVEHEIHNFNFGEDDFIYDESVVIFDGVAKLRSEYSYSLGKYELFGNGFYSESEVIDLMKFKTLESDIYIG